MTLTDRPLIEARVSWSFDEMMDIALMEVDFDDTTTNVRGRRALAIAKPTSRGYWPRRSTINLTTKVYSCTQSKNKQEYDKAIWILQIYMKYDNGGDP